MADFGGDSFVLFLSTPSARRATEIPFMLSGYTEISIHALREEGDTKQAQPDYGGTLFLSTPSARRATRGTDRPAQG